MAGEEAGKWKLSWKLGTAESRSREAPDNELQVAKTCTLPPDGQVGSLDRKPGDPGHTGPSRGCMVQHTSPQGQVASPKLPENLFRVCAVTCSEGGGEQNAAERNVARR